ncbi:MAG: PQQ-binding-like beta-propeller repeat protein [Thermoguttaceae bacterium]|jgi:outer membrane protein assembly factor BamB|nr:PQQ-binding-like beta-propeller repeat protein [Thermoguttaceae bacterium]
MKYPAITCLLLLVVSSSHAQNWPHWRGPFFNGSTEVEKLPTDWSTKENVAWSVPLPGVAASTPVVWEDRVFLTGVDEERDMLEVRCLSRRDGSQRWGYRVAHETQRDRRSNFASNSPVTDGEVVVFFFGNGHLLGYDLDGNRLWARDIEEDYGPFAFLWTFAASPTIWNGKLYIQVLQRDVPVEGRGLPDRENESYVLALDPKTGKTLWRHVRPSDAVAESREAFSTPIPFVFDGREELLVVGGDAITGHDPETGKEFWRWGAWNPTRIQHWRLVPSPVSGGGVILACAPKRSPVYAIPAGQDGQLADDAVVWQTDPASRVTSDVPTPAFYDGDFFVLNDLQKNLSRLDARTGEVKWQLATPGKGKYEASPLAADGKLYLIDFTGEVAVVDAKSGELLNTIAMDEPAEGEVVRSSVIAAHGQLFIRTTRRLYCVGLAP